MNTAQLKKPRFSGATLAKLVGITVKQFFNLRATGLMIDKSRYSLQDVFFVALCNDFRVRANKSWLSIIKLFETVFKDLETAENIDFINNDVLTIGFDGDKDYYDFMSINTPFIQVILNKYNYQQNDSFNSFCITIDHHESCYINLLKIRRTIINRAKELDLKVDVERVLLSA